ncbi:MAG: (d)CMP kinase [Deltaproteobacteria bacterium]|nr:(d)CMP kinase [Deltaproteobacteria bacterium]MBW1952612.1 (d)CMP kinase [Deltaproteobacteria bacterium]MBW1986261.1 (d)CMP kinase [Deltaproteobacteria bacterium]MBW2134158.1 (d)CMP kinase [Deltaproteobacteria bacterium]
MIITIDGPAGAGKSSVGKRLAQWLGYLYLDSGALYRAVALVAGRQDINLDDAQKLENFLANFDLRVDSGPEGFRLWSQSQEITQAIRQPWVSQAASRVATLSPVRQWVGTRLRAWGENRGIVTEGRDMGTMVFPHAEVKIYLDADPEVRLQRRRQQLQAQGRELPADQVRAELADRDQRDRQRQEAPLCIPSGAQVIDSTNLSLEEVVHACQELIRPVLEQSTPHAGSGER